ncbi:MAG: hypothetical protein QW128_04165 [Thermoprotei archaeon]
MNDKLYSCEVHGFSFLTYIAHVFGLRKGEDDASNVKPVAHSLWKQDLY